jgi:hypothetical protein
VSPCGDDTGGYDLIEGVEDWIAEQPWQAASSGWTVTGELQGWQYRIDITAAGLRISASASGGDPAVWIVTALRKVTGGR